MDFPKRWWGFGAVEDFVVFFSFPPEDCSVQVTIGEVLSSVGDSYA